MDIKKIAVIRGGSETEKEAALEVSKNFEKALEELGLNFIVVDLDEHLMSNLLKEKPDVALLALLGRYGEDGITQGICEYLKIPYTGSGVLASAVAMDKVFSKKLLLQSNVPTPRYQTFNNDIQSPDDFNLDMTFPVVMKPSNEGSSVGVSVCHNQEELFERLQDSQQFDSKMLIEDYIKGREFSVPILLDKALCPIEVVVDDEIYSYEAKYTAGKAQHIVPPQLPQTILMQLKEIALRAYHCHGARNYARVDLRLSSNGEIFVIEVNTLPTITTISTFSKSAAYENISISKIVSLLIESARLDYRS